MAEKAATAEERAGVVAIRQSLSEQQAQYSNLIAQLRKSEAMLRAGKKVTIVCVRARVRARVRVCATHPTIHTRPGTQITAQLLEDQHSAETKVTLLKQTVSDEKRSCDEQVAELQQQITELTFYLKTQRQIDQSPQSQKDELRSGTLVATQQEPNSRAGRRGTRSNRRR